MLCGQALAQHPLIVTSFSDADKPTREGNFLDLNWNAEGNAEGGLSWKVHT